MRGRTARVLLVAAVWGAVSLVLAPGAWAGGGAGGGCHSGPTQGKGDTVEMVEACFAPSTLHVEPGTEVTFVNLDPVAHNVGGNQWGHYDNMLEGDRFTARFDEAGIYAFACSYHPGMTGAIVVGDGLGAGNGPVIEVGSASSSDVEDDGNAEQAATAPVVSTGGSASGWLFGGLIGLAAGAAVTLGIGAVRRRAA